MSCHFEIRSHLKLPVQAAQLAGCFPLSLRTKSSKKDVRLELIFSWISVGILAATFRLAIYGHVAYQFLYRSMFENLSGGSWSKTLVFSESTSQIFAIIGDFATTIIFILRKNRINDFLNLLDKTIQELAERIGESHDKQLTQSIFSPFNFMKFTFGWISVMSLISLVISTWIVIPIYSEGYPNWSEGPRLIVAVLGYYEITMHFRLLSFLPMISFIHLLHVGFAMLRKKVESLSQQQEIRWITNNFCKLEELVQKFHSLFEFHLGIGMMTIMTTFVSVTFGEVLLTIQVARGVDKDKGWYHLISLVPWSISLCLLFYLLCDVSTRMTTEAKECVWAFRKSSIVDTLEPEEKQKLMMFYMDRCSRPPQVCPAKHFTLGKQIVPTVLGMVTTYLVVFYQFESDERKA